MSPIPSFQQFLAQVSHSVLFEALGSGVFHNASNQGFQEGYFAKSSEIENLFRDVGINPISIFSLRGIAAGQEESFLSLQEKDPELFQSCYSILAKTSSLPEVVEMGSHALFVGRNAS